MLQLLPVARIIVLVSAWYAFFTCMLLWLLWKHGVALSPLVAFSASSLLNGLVLLFLSIGWRTVWRLMPFLNRTIFPDLNGNRRATIEWSGSVGVGETQARVKIKQDFLRTSIEMDAPHSESHTVSLSTHKDPVSGRPVLHYIYEVHEKSSRQGAGQIYRGAASLKLDAFKESILSGNYFTSRHTTGHFKFVRSPLP